jgi:nucleotide-binding universal stress UspA family protein
MNGSRGLPSVVVGVDSSEHATRATDWAADEAGHLGGTLTLVHALKLGNSTGHLADVAYDERRRAEGTALLERTRTRLAERNPDLRVDAHLSDLAPARALIGMSRDAELLVTGSRGHGALAGKLLSSVSGQVVAHARCPVIVVHGEQPQHSAGEIVLGLGLHEDREPIDFAFRYAARLGLGIRVVRAYESLPICDDFYESDGLQAKSLGMARKAMEELLAPATARNPDVRYTLEPRQGHPEQVLHDAGQGAHLVVVGSRRRYGPHPTGSGTRHLVHGLMSRSRTPVAAVAVP